MKNLRRAVLGGVLVTAPAAWAQEAPARADGVLDIAAQLPRAGTFRVRAGALAFTSPSGADGSATTSVQWTFTERLAAGVEAQWRNGGPQVGVELRFQALAQRLGAPVDLIAAARVRSVGNEGVGGEVDGRLAVGRRFGAFELLANASLGVGFAGREDVDLEGVVSATYHLASGLRAGASARAHGELVDELKTAEDEGRPVGVLGGPTVAYRAGPLDLQLLVGWSAPRGSAAPGPAGAFIATFDF